MKIEKFKTILLTTLVLLSILLSYNLWTYQYNFPISDSSTSVQNVSLAGKREIRDIIQASQVIYHINNRHYMSRKVVDIGRVSAILEDGEIENITDITENMSIEDIHQFVTGDKKLEIIYPTYISLDILKKIYSIDGKQYNDLKINRIIMDVGGAEGDNATIYFVSLLEGKILQGTINDIPEDSLLNVGDYFQSKLPEAVKHVLANNRVLYLPKEPIVLQTLDVLADHISKDRFEKALFGGTDYLKGEVEGNIRSYTDGIRLLSLDSETGKLHYIDPSAQLGNEVAGSQLIQRSLDFINGHEGWTNDYFLQDWNEETGEFLFRMIKNNFPVFGGGTINGKFGREKIISYERFTYKLGNPLQSINGKVTLPSGLEVIEKLKNAPNINKEDVQNIVIGYKIKEIEGSTSEFVDEYLQLIPIWCIQYHSRYYQLEFDSEGGVNLIGLE